MATRTNFPHKETADGIATVIDFMRPRSGNSFSLTSGDADLIRIVRGETGQVRMGMELTLRFDYGLSVPRDSPVGEGLLKLTLNSSFSAAYSLS